MINKFWRSCFIALKVNPIMIRFHIFRGYRPYLKPNYVYERQQNRTLPYVKPICAYLAAQRGTRLFTTRQNSGLQRPFLERVSVHLLGKLTDCKCDLTRPLRTGMGYGTIENA